MMALAAVVLMVCMGTSDTLKVPEEMMIVMSSARGVMDAYVREVLAMLSTATGKGGSPSAPSAAVDVPSSRGEILGAEVMARCKELGSISDSDVHRERLFLSPAWERAALLLSEYMEDAGLEVWMDGIGNVHGRSFPDVVADPNAAAMMLGSHFDTIIDAGAFDGPLGVISSIAAAKALLLEREAAGKSIARPLEIVAFSDEEGVRFTNAPDIFLSSEALTGSLVPKGGLQLRDANGVTLSEALREFGIDGSAEGVSRQALDPEKVHAFVELHIEQGPILEAMNVPVGVVTAINGMTGFGVTIKGKQGHAGTTRMDMRKDSLAAASELILAIEKVCATHEGALSSMLVCTVGKLNVEPAVSNVISGNVHFTVDARSSSHTILTEVVDSLKKLIFEVCARRDLSCALDKEKPVVPPVYMDEGISNSLKHAVSKAGAGSDAIWGANVVGGSSPDRNVVPMLPSGANHDAGMMVAITRVGMLWVRCKDGISHSPLEDVADRDGFEGAMALFNFLDSEM